MSLISKLKAFFEGWQRINKPPKWVWKAYNKWERKLPTHPYNMTKHFVGKRFVYRVRHGMGNQGEAPIIGWYKKKRKPKFNRSGYDQFGNYKLEHDKRSDNEFYS